jgi:RHS repeat-associated protein
MINPFNDSCKYGYDGVGRLNSQINVIGSTIIYKRVFALNANGEKVDEQVTGPTLKHLREKTDTFIYSPVDVLLANSETAYAHDNAGNRKSGTTVSFVERDSFSADNFLLSVTDTSGITTFRYDALGNRIGRIKGTLNQRFVHDLTGRLPQVLQEVDATGAIKANYVYGLGLIARIDANDSVLYYHFDAQHNTIALSNDSGRVTDTYIYESFGKMVKHTGTSRQPYTFMGQYGIEQEMPTLYYMRARYYDARNHSFLSKDPYPATLENPQSLNRYVYALNNPLSMFDPTGLCAEGDNAGPWQVGWEWLTATGPRNHSFTNGDPFTELLKKHNHIVETRALIIQNIKNGGPLKGKNNYSLKGVGGVVTFLKDYSTLLTNGLTGNLAATYLGSYTLNYNILSINGTSAIVQFNVSNSSTIGSATHLPIQGYSDYWDNYIATPLNTAFLNGPMSKTTQNFQWEETLTW